MRRALRAPISCEVTDPAGAESLLNGLYWHTLLLIVYRRGWKGVS